MPAAGIETASAVPGQPEPGGLADGDGRTADVEVREVDAQRLGALGRRTGISHPHGQAWRDPLVDRRAPPGLGKPPPEILKLNHDLCGARRSSSSGLGAYLPAGSQANGERATAATDRDHSRYTVVKGDTLSEIAFEHLIDADASA